MTSNNRLSRIAMCGCRSCGPFGGLLILRISQFSRIRKSEAGSIMSVATNDGAPVVLASHRDPCNPYRNWHCIMLPEALLRYALCDGGYNERHITSFCTLSSSLVVERHEKHSLVTINEI